MPTGVYNHQKRGVYIKCQFCDKEFYTKKCWIGKKKFCSQRCYGDSLKGIICNQPPILFREKHPNWKGGKSILKCLLCGNDFYGYVSNKSKFCSKKCVLKYSALNSIGEKNPAWKGGTNKIQNSIRGTSFYSDWRNEVLRRDDYTCQISGKRGGKIEVDHIKPLSLIIKENNIKNMNDALECKELWDINNGRTLNKQIHKLTSTYGAKALKLL